MHQKEKCPRIVAELSNLSYGMYLMHILWLGLWVKIFKDDYALPTVAAIPVIAIATFLSSWLATRLLAFIPGFKFLMGVPKSRKSTVNTVTT